jgi:hypothetical protein
MSAEHDKHPGGFRVETCFTNDYLVPFQIFGSQSAHSDR